MDKGRFLEIAPQYYALAIAYYFNDRDSYSATVEQISERLEGELSQIGEVNVGGLLMNVALCDMALKWLTIRGLVRVIEDDFAPTTIVRTVNFRARYIEACSEFDSPFEKFGILKSSTAWLRDALLQVEALADKFGVSSADYEALDNEWTPLLIDREEPEFTAALQKVEEAVEEIRSDNGYAATFPDERDFVLERLSALVNRLRNASSISFAYVKRNGLDTLSRLVRRFVGAAKELAFAAAREAVKDWLRKRGITFLDHIDPT